MNELIFRYLYDFVAGRVWLRPLVIFGAVWLGWVLVLVWIFIFVRRARAREFIFTGGAAGLAWLLTQLIKWFWPVARPFVALTDVAPLVKASGAGAFPSGHAAFFFALALALYALDRRLGQWFVVGALAISLSRIMAGVHWPADILGGLAVAIFSVFFTLFLVRLFKPGFGLDRF